MSGCFGVGVGSENYFGVYWVTQNSLHFQYWPIQGHLGLSGAIFGSFRVGVRSEICIGVSSYIRKKSFSKHCFILRFYFWPILGSFWAFWDCVGLFWVWDGLFYGRGKVRKQFWSLLIYQKKNCLLSIVLSCILIFDQFKGHFGLFGAVSGYFGVGVGSENCFWDYLYILSNFVSWVTQNSLLFEFWPTQGHFGLFGLHWAILGSGKDQKSVLESLHISEKNHFLGFTLSCVFSLDQF